MRTIYRRIITIAMICVIAANVLTVSQVFNANNTVSEPINNFPVVVNNQVLGNPRASSVTLTNPSINTTSIEYLSTQQVNFSVKVSSDEAQFQPRLVTVSLWDPFNDRSWTGVISKVDSGDDDFTDGVVYARSLRFDGGTLRLPGPLYYKFEMTYSVAGVDGFRALPEDGFYTDLEITNDAPTLTNPWVTPSEAEYQGSDRVLWQVEYTDANDNEPTEMKVFIYDETDTEFEGFDMEYDPFEPFEPFDPSGETIIYSPSEGRIYYLRLSVDEYIIEDIGTHKYYFEAFDGNETVRLPTSGYYENYQTIRPTTSRRSSPNPKSRTPSSSREPRPRRRRNSISSTPTTSTKHPRRSMPTSTITAARPTRPTR